MTRDSLQANVDALKALPGLLLGPQWRIRVANLGSYALIVLGLLAQVDWSQGDLALLFPAAVKPWLTKASLAAGGVLKVYELCKKTQRDKAQPSAPPTP